MPIFAALIAPIKTSDFPFVPCPFMLFLYNAQLRRSSEPSRGETLLRFLLGRNAVTTVFSGRFFARRKRV